jgi:D-alanyl-D-alanine carboxypeptidase/D-alanyl-D-alanine-endopeptidase (penicillin-binding protein 4)
VVKGFSKKLLVLTVLGLCLPATAQAGLAGRINSIISRKSQKKVRFAVKVINAKTGKTLYEYNAHKPMIPASNMKIMASAAALEYLGPGYKFTTKVGLLDKTLVVIGSGDPLLADNVTDKKHGRGADWIFADIIAALRKKGAGSIKDIVIDSSFFDDNRVHPNWPREQLNRPYACETSGLNYNGNCIQIITKNTGGKVSVNLRPQTDYVQIINKVTAISRGNSAVGAYRGVKPNKLTVKGKCRKRTTFDVAIERPAAFFGFVLAEKLAEAGIKVQGQLEEKYIKKDQRIKILRTYITPMSDVLARCNKDSLGLAAESLVKTISAVKSGGLNGEWGHGLSLISRYLVMLGIDGGEFHLDDGSGLSKENRLSPNAITRVLSDVYKDENWGFFKDSLAVGGVDGTIAKYFKDKKYKGKIFGKTGYVNLAKTFCGVCITDNGDYIFSILTTGANGQTRKAINDIAKSIIDNAN